MKHAQSSIAGFLLLTAIAISVVGGAYIWAEPLLEKVRNQEEIFRLENRMLETYAAIKKVANEQSLLSVSFDIKKGTLSVLNSTLKYEATFSLADKYNDVVLIGNRTEVGLLGQAEPAYILERGAIEMILQPIVLNDTTTGKCYGIQIKPGEQASAGIGSHIVFLKWLGENYTSYTGCLNITYQMVSVNIE